MRTIRWVWPRRLPYVRAVKFQQTGLVNIQDLMDTTVTASLYGDIDSESFSSDLAESTQRHESPPPPPPPPRRFSSNRRLVAAHTRHAGHVSGDVHAALQESDSSLDSQEYSHRFCDSEESEPPRYGSLNTVSHYPPAADTVSKDKSRAPILPPKLPPGTLWRKEQQISCTTDHSYRSIQLTVHPSPGHHAAAYPHGEGRLRTRREAVQQTAERMSQTYFDTLSYCGLPVIVKPKSALVYASLALTAVNTLALILSWAALFKMDPSPAIITYSLTALLGVSCVPCLFVLWANKFNPFAALSAFASTAFSGTLVAGLLQAFFVANNMTAFGDTNMAALGSVTASLDLLAAILWLLVVIVSLIFYTADSEQRGHFVIQFIAFNTLAILVLVAFSLTILMDIIFLDKAGQIDIMYLAVGFSLLSILFSLCFCFCTGVSLKERETEERDEWSKFIKLLPFVISAILTIWTFICGILSMMIGTSLSHDPDYSETYGGSIAVLAYIVGTLNFGVSIATISVGCILGVHTFL